MEEQTFSIGKVAKLLDIPAATLRFWEEMGLFSAQKGENRYRVYTPRDLVRIADIVFLRTAGMPVKHIAQIQSLHLDEYEREFQQLECQLKGQLEHFQQMHSRTQQQLARIHEVLRLAEQTDQPEELPFEKITLFDYQEKEKLLQYSRDPTLYVRYFDTRDMSSEARCIVAPPGVSEGQIHWEKRAGTVFLTFLIRERVKRDYQSDVLESLARIQQHHRTGVLLAQYLLTTVEGDELTDFLKGYVELVE